MIAKAFIEIGVKKGDRIAMLSAARNEFLTTFLASGKIGAVWLGLSPKATLDELALSHRRQPTDGTDHGPGISRNRPDPYGQEADGGIPLPQESPGHRGSLRWNGESGCLCLSTPTGIGFGLGKTILRGRRP